MTEEESMEAALEPLLAKIIPGTSAKQHWIILAHEGRRDLERSFPRKFRAWQERDAQFLILRDNDGAECTEMKQRLVDLTPASVGRPTPIIRIVCQELEGWFLGDLDAVSAAYPKAKRHQRFKTIAKRDPDTLTNASQLTQEITGTGAKVLRARQIAEFMDPSSNRSKSFQVFKKSVEDFFRPPPPKH